MSRLQELEKTKIGVEAMVQMSSVFEGIASMKIAKIKNQVLQATLFFVSALITPKSKQTINSELCIYFP